MKIQFLGTAAAEAIPALWCECELCRRARDGGGPDLRRRSALLVDADTLIDFGPDLNWQVNRFRIDLTAVRRILNTHSHEDHLSPVELFWRQDGFSRVTRPLAFYGNRRAIDTVGRLFEYYSGKAVAALKTDFRELRPYETVSDGDLRVTTFKADHAHDREEALSFLLERGGRRVLFSGDTGLWEPAGWQAVSGIRLDALVVECTSALKYRESMHWHLGVDGTLAFRNRLIEEGCLDLDTPAWVTHFSHNGGASHAELEAFFAPYGMSVAWDGAVFEV